MFFYIIIRQSFIDFTFIEQIKEDGHSVNTFFEFDKAIQCMSEEKNNIDLVIASETAIDDDNSNKYELLKGYLKDIRALTKAKILLQLSNEPTCDFDEYCTRIGVNIQKGDTIDLNIGETSEVETAVKDEADADKEIAPEKEAISESESAPDNEADPENKGELIPYNEDISDVEAPIDKETLTENKSILLAVSDEYEKIISSISNINIFGNSKTKSELIDMAKDLEPEIIIMTSELPGDEDKGITYVIEQISLDIRIIMILTKRLNDLIIGKLERLGGVEFVNRNDRDNLIEELKELIFKDGIEHSNYATEKKKNRKNEVKEIDLKNNENDVSNILEIVKIGAGNTVNSLLGFGKSVSSNIAKGIETINIVNKFSKVKKFKEQITSKESPHESPQDAHREPPEELYQEYSVEHNQELPAEPHVEHYLEECTASPQFRLVAVISNGHTGKTTIAANLAYLASDKKINTALVDLNLKQFDMYYCFNIREKQILQNLNHPGYNKYNMIYNALDEPDIDCLPDIAYQENKHLSVFSGDDEEENPIPDADKVLKLLDRLRSLYGITIIDTGRYDSLVHNIVSIADTVLFVHDLNPASTRKNEKLLMQLSRTSNLKKFYLIINGVDEIDEMSASDLIKYYKSENGITFKDVFTIPMNSKACINSSWARSPIYKSKYDVSHELSNSFDNIFTSLFGNISQSKQIFSKNRR